MGKHSRHLGSTISGKSSTYVAGQAYDLIKKEIDYAEKEKERLIRLRLNQENPENQRKHAEYEAEKAHKKQIHTTLLAKIKSIMDELRPAMLQDSETMASAQIMKKHSQPLQKLLELSEELFDYESCNTIMNRYESFLLELAKSRQKFASILPTRLFTFSPSIALTSIAPEERLFLQKRLEKDNIFNNAHFRNTYLHLFPDHISEICTFDRFLITVKIDHNAIKNANQSIQKELELDYSPKRKEASNIKSEANLTELFKTAPETIIYLNEIQQCFTIKHNARKFGALLRKSPYIMTHISENAIPTEIFKTLVQSIPKIELYTKCNDQLSRFPELKEFLEQDLNGRAKFSYSDDTIATESQ